ncbi:hypothetical protein [Candidatus Poriferisocius sp.]|uniref:hypothetical protein n=1 Tax=Candidatus Poriferisocius sp. TaxID=3101276 RepID=UPI003B02411A
MQIVDDRLALKALEGWHTPHWGGEVPTITWLSHARLLRALMSSSTTGSLSRAAFEGALEAALSPPADVLRVLDPRPYTADAARLMASHRISLLAAGMLAPAIRHGGRVHVHQGHYVGGWDDVVDGTDAKVRVFQESELRSGL